MPSWPAWTPLCCRFTDWSLRWPWVFWKWTVPHWLRQTKGLRRRRTQDYNTIRQRRHLSLSLSRCSTSANFNLIHTLLQLQLHSVRERERADTVHSSAGQKVVNYHQKHQTERDGAPVKNKYTKFSVASNYLPLSLSLSLFFSPPAYHLISYILWMEIAFLLHFSLSTISTN